MSEAASPAMSPEIVSEEIGRKIVEFVRWVREARENRLYAASVIAERARRLSRGSLSDPGLRVVVSCCLACSRKLWRRLLEEALGQELARVAAARRWDLCHVARSLVFAAGVVLFDRVVPAIVGLDVDTAIDVGSRELERVLKGFVAEVGARAREILFEKSRRRVEALVPRLRRKVRGSYSGALAFQRLAAGALAIAFVEALESELGGSR